MRKTCTVTVNEESFVANVGDLLLERIDVRAHRGDVQGALIVNAAAGDSGVAADNTVGQRGHAIIGQAAAVVAGVVAADRAIVQN